MSNSAASKISCMMLASTWYLPPNEPSPYTLRASSASIMPGTRGGTFSSSGSSPTMLNGKASSQLAWEGLIWCFSATASKLLAVHQSYQASLSPVKLLMIS